MNVSAAVLRIRSRFSSSTSRAVLGPKPRSRTAALARTFSISVTVSPSNAWIRFVRASEASSTLAFGLASSRSASRARISVVSASSGRGRSRTFTSFSSSGISGNRAPRKMTVTGLLRIAQASSRSRRTKSGLGAPYSSK